MELFDYPEGKTNYQIRNEHGELTTITLEKWVADILQIELPDVHKAVQRAYDTVVKNHPELSRREKRKFDQIRFSRQSERVSSNKETSARLERRRLVAVFLMLPRFRSACNQTR